MIRIAAIAMFLTACAPTQQQPSTPELLRAVTDCAAHGGLQRAAVATSGRAGSLNTAVRAQCADGAIVIRERRQ